MKGRLILPCLFAALLGACAQAGPSVLPPAEIDAEVAAFYRARNFRPLWLAGRALKPEAAMVQRMTGLTLPAIPESNPRSLVRADLMLSQAYADHVRARHRPPANNAMRYIDPGLAPVPRSGGDILAALAGARSLRAHLDAVQRINPALAGLERGLARYRQSPTRRPSDERLILANIERARAIPARPGGRYILVDTASAQLFMVENSRIAGRMRVIVGKRAMQTPLMAGMIRYAVLNPYWNLPPDLIRERARKGLRGIRAERLEALSDWSPLARRLDPRRVDWRAVAAGRRLVNLRQTPGPHNMMGRIKFMLPNDLGIYLHDTPHRHLFALADRRASSGCVRLEDAGRLERWLFNGRPPRPSGAPEQRVDLPAPVPVYITYLTVLPSAEGVVFQRDAYNRDVSPASARRPAARARRAAPAPSRARRGRGAAARPARRP